MGNGSTQHRSEESDSATTLSTERPAVITRIHATDIAVGLRRIPVGFYISVHTDGVERLTTNKPISLDQSIVEWDDEIVLPLARSSMVHFRIVASFEFLPLLGDGESLHEFDVSVDTLLDRSKRTLPLRFPLDEDDLPCYSSLVVTVEERSHVYCDQVARCARRIPHVDPLTRRLGDITNDGQRALSRFRKDQECEYLEMSIKRFRCALDLCPPAHACFSVILFNLAVAELIRCQAASGTEFNDVDIAVTLFRDALELRPTGHPDRPATLFHLAAAHLSRLGKHGDRSDADAARALLSQVLELCPTQNYHHRSALVVLEMSCVDRAGTPKGAMRSTSERGEVDMAAFHFSRFQEFGRIEDLDSAISLLDNVVRLTRYGDPNMFNFSMRLAMLYSIRFEHLDQLSDLSRSISTLEGILPLCPHGGARALIQNNLGHMLRTRFERLGDPSDVEKSVLALDDAVRLTPDGPNTDKPNMLGNLSASLRSRFERFGNVADIDRSIAVAEDVLRRVPAGHPNGMRALSSLGASLQARFERLGDVADINRSITILEDAIRITSDDYPDRPIYCNHLGGALLKRFEHLGDLTDIYASISMLEQSINRTPDDHSYLPSRLSNLGYALSVRSHRLGDVEDIHRSISLLEDALRRTPEGNPSRTHFQYNLSRALSDRSEFLGDVEDIDRAVALFDDVVRRTPKDHPEGRSRLGDLSDCLRKRFRRLDDLVDLKRALSVLEDALAYVSERHHGEAMMISNLGGLLIEHFGVTDDVADINRAVSLGEEALRLVPDDSADKPAILSNLCSALSKRFERFCDVADVNKAISCYEDALRLLPEDHPYRPGFLKNLGLSLSLRFERLGDEADIDKAISSLEESVNRTPDELPTKTLRLTTLGVALITRFERLDDYSVLPKAQSNFALAARLTTGATTVRFKASIAWIKTTHMLGGDAMDGYALTIGLLPQLAWIGLSLQDRHRLLQQVADVACDAAACAIELGRTQTAVEWLEQGRSVVWSQQLQLRTPLDELGEEHPALAERLLRVSKELETASTRDPLSSRLVRSGDMNAVSSASEQEARRHRALARERDTLLSEVRSFPGFERFLLPKTFVQLSAAAHSGPVAILNVSNRRCDALIVTAGSDTPIHVPLHDINCSAATALQTMLRNLLESGGGRVSEPEPDLDRAARLASRRLGTGDGFKHILSALWRNIVRSVLEKLEYMTPAGELRRIFWCPTGPLTFLPIHAAGLYDTDELGSKVFDFVISSYTPTLDALVIASEETVATGSASASLHILAVPQPESDGQARLPGARHEIAQLRRSVDALSSPSSEPIVILLQSTGTVEDVLAQMPHAHWVHFACHGIQDARAPLDSGLVLAAGRRLRLSDIVHMSSTRRDRGKNLPFGTLAFLSACQTATGDQALREEAVHLAAGMLLAGYRSVIATTWSIGDEDAPEVARGVYERLFDLSEGKEERGKGGDWKGPDARGAARALHEAVAHLRARGAPFISWVPFVHVGL